MRHQSGVDDTGSRFNPSNNSLPTKAKKPTSVLNLWININFGSHIFLRLSISKQVRGKQTTINTKLGVSIFPT